MSEPLSNVAARMVITDRVVQDALFLHGDEEEATWSQLLAPENVETTCAVLTDMAIRVNNDLARKGNTPYPSQDELARYHDWRRRALNFKAGVERRLGVAKRQLRATRAANADSQNSYIRTVLRMLAKAVLDHQKASAGYDAETYDLVLWEKLDDLFVPIGEAEASLRQLLESGAWT